MLPGFQTAHGKKIDISTDVVERRKSIFKEDFRDLGGNRFPGFQTAQGNKIGILTDVERSKSIFKEDFRDLGGNKFPGFQTAQGKKIDVSTDSVEKGTSIFNKEDFKDLGRNGFPGFQTAQGSKIHISTDAVGKGKLIFKEEDFKDLGRNGFPGFQTAQGSKIHIATDAVVKGKSIFKEEDFKDLGRNGFPGFQTGQGSKIHIATDAVEKGTSIFKESFDDLRGNRFPGFKIGNVERIESPELINCRRNLFQNESQKEIESEVEVTHQTPERRIPSKRELELSDFSEEEELSPIINFRQRPSQDANDKNVLANISKNLFQNFTNATASTPVGTTSPNYSRRFALSSQDIDESPEPGPSSKRIKVASDTSEIEMPKDNDLSGFTQEMSDLASDCVADFEKSRLLDEDDSNFDSTSFAAIMVDTGVLTSRENYRLQQITELKTKKLGIIKPIPGSLTRQRGSKSRKRITFLNNPNFDLSKHYNEAQLLSLGVRKSIMDINPHNALEFRFDGIEFFGEQTTLTNTTGICVGDDIVLMFGYDCKIGIKEIANGFMCCPGVDPELVSNQWISNHYKWIVWTLSSYEMKFPEQFGGNALTPHNVVARLKYRYDREIDSSERSALHRIIEQDDTPAKRIILVISNIIYDDGSFDDDDDDEKSDENETKRKDSPHLELTDGWYSIDCISDAPFQKFIQKGIVTIGTKLCLHSTELIASEPVHPLEAKGKVKLRFGSNAVRRAKWNCRLGFCNNPRPFPIKLKSVISDGGLIPLLHVIVARVYPLLYHCKTADGKSVFYSEKYYEKNNWVKEREKERQVELLYSEAQKEFEENLNKNKTRRSSRLMLKPMKKDELERMSADDLLELLESTPETSSIEMLLSKSKLESIRAVRTEQQDKIRASIEKIFEKKMDNLKSKTVDNLTPLLKVRLLDISTKPEEVEDIQNRATLTIWRPQEDILRILKEGSLFKILSVIPSNSGIDYEKRLNASRSTRYLPLTTADNQSTLNRIQRRIYPINEVLKINFAPVFQEFDTVGLVVHISAFVEKTGQTVYIADDEEHILAVRLWSDIPSQGLEEILKIPNFIALSNLQWRISSRKNLVITAYSQDCTIISLHPKEHFLKEELQNLKNSMMKVKDLHSFVKQCETKINERLKTTSFTNNFRRSV